MTLASWKDSVTRLRAYPIDTGIDGIEWDWSEPDSIQIDNCLIRATSSETAEGRIIQRYTLLCHYDTDIEPDDRVLWEGRYFTVVGAPMPARSFSGITAHIRVNLEVADG